MSEISYTSVEVKAIARNLEVEFATCSVHRSSPEDTGGGGYCWNATLQQPRSPLFSANWDVMDRTSLWHAVIDAIRMEVVNQIESEIGSWRGGIS